MLPVDVQSSDSSERLSNRSAAEAPSESPRPSVPVQKSLAALSRRQFESALSQPEWKRSKRETRAEVLSAIAKHQAITGASLKDSALAYRRGEIPVCAEAREISEALRPKHRAMETRSQRGRHRCARATLWKSRRQRKNRFAAPLAQFYFGGASSRSGNVARRTAPESSEAF